MKHVRQPGSHRAQPGKRRAEPPGRRRADARPRYGRIAVFCASATVTGVAVLGALNLVPDGTAGDATASAGDDLRPAVADGSQEEVVEESAAPEPDGKQAARTAVTDRGRAREAPAGAVTQSTVALPADSGSGYRVVFSESQQRVWLVDEAEQVARTYPVSGSLYDNLDPGTYEVYSTSRYAVGIDDSGTMEYFVRFTQGDEGAAIGFHTIPVDDGAPVQTEAQLGTPLSHGCIRQREEDAIALWEFAPIGTTVVVVA